MMENRLCALAWNKYRELYARLQAFVIGKVRGRAGNLQKSIGLVRECRKLSLTAIFLADGLRRGTVRQKTIYMHTCIHTYTHIHIHTHRMPATVPVSRNIKPEGLSYKQKNRECTLMVIPLAELKPLAIFLPFGILVSLLEKQFPIISIYHLKSF